MRYIITAMFNGDRIYYARPGRSFEAHDAMQFLNIERAQERAKELRADIARWHRVNWRVESVEN